MKTRCSLHSWSMMAIVGAWLVHPAGSLAGSCEVWLTDPAGSARFEKQSDLLSSASATEGLPGIEVSLAERFQAMEGFGYILTGGSAQHIVAMSTPARTALLRELFASDSTNIGVSYLRVSIGASDLNDHVFTYDDVAPGETDMGLARFSLGPDRQDVIPVLQEILRIFPELKILGSPWTAPVWMKTNGDARGGSLKPECYAVYARYLVQYVEAMKAAGIPIDAITPQNEPLHPGNNPSMFMSAADQADFIKNHLGPAFKAAGLGTKIICYDHNADRPDYPLAILNDSQAKPFVEGSAFHLYGGRIEALTQVHEAHPDKGLYFTEQWIGAPGNLRKDLAFHTSQLIIGASRNWCRTVLEWNLAADPRYQPHTDRGGCDRCLGAITIDRDQVIRNPAYYIIAHASKFVRPGSVRIGSSLPASLPNVAFQSPEGRIVLVVLNQASSPQTFVIRQRGECIAPTLPGGAVATYVWSPFP